MPGAIALRCDDCGDMVDVVIEFTGSAPRGEIGMRLIKHTGCNGTPTASAKAPAVLGSPALTEFRDYCDRTAQRERRVPKEWWVSRPEYIAMAEALGVRLGVGLASLTWCDQSVALRVMCGALAADRMRECHFESGHAGPHSTEGPPAAATGHPSPTAGVHRTVDHVSCVECGAGVVDVEKHQAWHHEQRRRAERVDTDLREHTEVTAQLIRRLGGLTRGPTR